MIVKSLKLVLEIDGEDFEICIPKFKIDKKFKLSSRITDREKLRDVVREYLSKINNPHHIDVTKLNIAIGGAPSKLLSGALDGMGYKGKFRKKINSKYHYFRYNELVMSESKLKALL